MIDYTGFKIILLMCLTIIFCASIVMIDYSFSAILAGKEVVLQSLFFTHLEPRVAYHLGLVLLIGVYLVLGLMFLNELIYRVYECEGKR